MNYAIVSLMASQAMAGTGNIGSNSVTLIKEGIYAGDGNFQIRVNAASNDIFVTEIADQNTGSSTVAHGTTAVYRCVSGSSACYRQLGPEDYDDGSGSEHNNGSGYGSQHPKIQIINQETFLDEFGVVVEFVGPGNPKPASHLSTYAMGVLDKNKPWGFYSPKETVYIVDPTNGSIILSKPAAEVSRYELEIFACASGKRDVDAKGRSFCGGSLKKCSRVSEPKYNVIKEMNVHGMFRMLCEVTRTYWK